MKKPGLVSAAVTMLAASLVLAGCGGGADAGGEGDEPIQLTYATYFGDKSYTHLAAQWWMDEVTERTDGRVTFRVMGGGALLGAAEMLEGVSTGRADLGQSGDAYFPGDLPLSVASGAVPFVTDNPFAHAAAHQWLYQHDENFKAEYDAQNVVVPFFIPTTPSVLGVKGELGGLDDLKGKNVRASGGAIEMLKVAGANPMAMPAGETYESLERGLLDGFFGFQMDSVTDFGVYEVTDNIYYASTGTFAIVDLFFNKDVWEGLPDDVRDIMTEVGNEVVDGTMELMEELETKTCDKLTDAGMQPQLFPEAEVDRWRDLTGTTLADGWKAAAESAGTGVEDLDAWYDDYVALIKRMETEHPHTTGAITCAGR
ncbi:TRAP transporter substrate-binding protein DctP [Microbacterium sp. No. 7]|uniref:TRAP transporter substrate-binding protein DctP n=1 Tax=Microbacterium sp. No. 7 TaxID=1714373 RepID=UPI0006ECE97D|nr:TRAP transporter substrate-binding protein DctP [Microbacterium sp. No. 7]ALJ20857.1 hypothetical protein AOA12_13460 [Microbacterium sp. No. 7]